MMWLVHIVAITGSTIISGYMGSLGASAAVVGEGSLHKQATTPVKPGASVISCTSLGDSGGDTGCNSTVCRHSSTLRCQALLPPVLWLWCLHFNSPRSRVIGSMAVTGWGGCSTFIQPGKLLLGASTFPCSLCHAWRAVSFSAGLLTVTGR